MLLRKATDANETLRLWTFQRNTDAIRFYESHGFKLVRETSGADNEEHEPDALYRWSLEQEPHLVRFFEA